jgi:hypothetical protein
VPIAGSVGLAAKPVGSSGDLVTACGETATDGFDFETAGTKLRANDAGI